MREGTRSPAYGALGVHFISSGPPNGPLHVVIYDEHDQVVRRLRQRQGAILQEGYVDFFNSSRCRPTVAEYHIVDVDERTGQETILATHTGAEQARAWLQTNFRLWVEQHTPVTAGC